MSRSSRFAPVPTLRVNRCNSAPVRRDADYVLYWSLTARRPTWNFSLQRAIDWALELARPLLILETVICDYPWASDRLPQFILEGMAANAQRFADQPVMYYPYIEREPGRCAQLLDALVRHACLVVTDEFPCFFLPRYVAAAARALPALVEQVDSNGLLPLRAAPTVFPTAYAFRRFFQRTARSHLLDFPRPDPLKGAQLPRLKVLPADIARKLQKSEAELRNPVAAVRKLPIDHSVSAGRVRGGADSAQALLRQFVATRLAAYREQRNEPEKDASSGLSPYLHFGHISVHEVFDAVSHSEEWTPDKLSDSTAGKREGWWGMSPSAEGFLDELITWRELGFNYCFHRDDYDQFESLPDWARVTLQKHASDRRKYVYELGEFEQARTHDVLWNAAQLQIVREGRMHNYLRMLWGKKILEWSRTPQVALRIMIELNNKYGLDGRDPNSYTGIMWVLGRFDRPWAPEREIFGVVRYMSSENTARKFRVKDYIARYAPG